MAHPLARRSLLVLAATLLAGASALSARPAAAAPASPVAVIRINKVLDQLDEKSERERELRELIDGAKTKLEQMEKDLGAGQADLKILPAGGPDFIAKRNELARLRLSMRAELNLSKLLIDEKGTELRRDLFLKISDATTRLAQREGYLLVITDDSEVDIPTVEMVEGQYQAIDQAIVTRRIVFADPSVDISDDVARLMNNEYKAAASAAKPAAGAARK